MTGPVSDDPPMDLRYFRYRWEENRGDQYSGWGRATYLFATDASGVVEQQFEVYDDGHVLLYDLTTEPTATACCQTSAPISASSPATRSPQPTPLRRPPTSSQTIAESSGRDGYALPIPPEIRRSQLTTPRTGDTSRDPPRAPNRCSMSSSHCHSTDDLHSGRADALFG